MERLKPALKFMARHPLLSVFAAALASLLLLAVISLLSDGAEKVSPETVRQGLVDESNVEERDLFQVPTSDPADSIADPYKRSDYERYLEEAKTKGVAEEDLHYDGTAKDFRKRRKFTENHDGMYSLPYRSSTIYAEYVEVTPDGRYVIKVTYNSSLARAKWAWRQHLKRHNDSGRSYLVVYERG